MIEKTIEEFVDAIRNKRSNDYYSRFFKMPLIEDLEKTNLKNKYFPLVEKECAKIGDTKISDREECNRYYTLYMTISKLCYAFFEILPHLSKDAEGILQDFKNNKFHLLESSKAKLVNNHLKPIYLRLEDVCKTQQSTPVGVNRKDYAVGGRLPNQIPLEFLKKHELKGVDDAFNESEIGNIIRHYYGSNFGAIQIRTWRYFSGEPINTHRDGLPPHCFKLMIFNGDITTKHGCFEGLKPPPKPVNIILQAIGKHPCVLVEPNVVLHRALSPQPNLHRDTIEITIAPRIGDAIFVDAGCLAGHPFNPFSNWSEKL
jgi:hypothetical protein